METAFPVHDPLFPKRQTEHKDDVNTEVEEDNKTPEDWLEHLTEGEISIKEEESGDISKCNEVDASQQASNESCSPNTHNLIDDSKDTAEAPLQENTDDNIVLGPGGQWGLPYDHSMFRHSDKEGNSALPRVPAWSLPPTRQQWEFSEITHHGRKKHKSLNRKKKKGDE